jgi:acetate kinase
MKIVTINLGSSSLKYALYDADQTNIFSGKIARIDESGVVHKTKRTGEDEVVGSVSSKNIRDWVNTSHEDIQDLVNDDDFVLAVRVVHDGGKFEGPTKYSKEVHTILHEVEDIAPLHMPLVLEVLPLLQEIYSKDIWLVFDTHFHKTIPSIGLHTGLPKDLETDLGLRKFGFHGLSHQYIAEQIHTKGVYTGIISCHLGSGSSICAIENGKSIQTSMGFGPGEGLMMATRSGSVDWEALLYAMEKENISISEARNLLYKKSGILGITHTTDLMPEVLEDASKPENKEVVDRFVYQVSMVIGSYLPLFKEAPTHVVFTGGIGSGSYLIRSLIIEHLLNLGLKIDTSKNLEAGDAKDLFHISHSESSMEIITLPTDEEQILMAEVRRMLD